MKSVRVICLVGCICWLCSCSPTPDTPMAKQSPGEAAPSAAAIQSSPRIQVTRIGVIEDDIAYGERRGIYVIKDTKTDREYIGVSGVGITETGVHYVSTGKSGYIQSDER